MSNVKFVRSELTAIMDTYQLIGDTIAGQKAIKSKQDKYLPVPSSCIENGGVRSDRYKAYILRALYYNVTKPTRDALVGQLFLRPPKVTVPTELNKTIENINGKGLTFQQLMRQSANHILPYGRGGFLVDYPKTENSTTKGDLESGKVKATVKFINPWTITNWLIDEDTNQLVLLVLREKYLYRKDSNDFEIKQEDRHRVYDMKTGSCVCTVYQEGKIIESVELRNGKGKPFDYIPFVPIGSENNDMEIDEPPFENLANLNVSHYRNSADYEESVFLVGQPTPVYSGLTPDWVENYFPKGIPFGSRASIPLPVTGKAELLQASPNTLAYESMVHKEEQMIAIGAKIINPTQTVERKEAEIQIEAASQKSVLTTIKDNLELAIVKALGMACDFVNANKEEIEVELNENFDLTSMTAEEIRWLIELYNNRLLSHEDAHENLRRSGISKKTAEESRSSIEQDMEFRKKVEPVEPATNSVGNNNNNED